jgi:cytochrome c peroxidase
MSLVNLALSGAFRGFRWPGRPEQRCSRLFTGAGHRPAAYNTIPQPPAADLLKLSLGESLFNDHRLAHDGTLACAFCHDLRTDRAGDNQRMTARNGSTMFTVLSVFNAALNFRLNWEGNIRTLEGQAQSSLENPANMATSIDEVLAELKMDPKIVVQFVRIYGHQPNRASLPHTLATYERTLLTPGSRFDRWLQGDAVALTADERSGYRLFQSLGCISCHQGVNVGGNLYERHGISHQLASPYQELLRVPSLRNVAVMAPYFHDSSSPTLQDAVRKMVEAQLDRSLSDQQIAMIASFLDTLTDTFHSVPVTAPPR